MTPNELLQELDDFVELLAVSELAVGTSKAIEHWLPGSVRRITWSSNPIVPGDLFRGDIMTVADYQEWVSMGGYSAVLFDGALLQLSFDFRGSELVGHRLAYLPCPFQVDFEMMSAFSLSELMDLYCEEPSARVAMKSPVRFDFDPRNQAGNHPASHLTMQRSTVRMPVVAPLSPGHFIHFVFANFYPTLWSVHDFLRDWPRYEFGRTILREEEDELYINWRS